MLMRTLRYAAAFGAGLLITASATAGTAATNTVPSTHLGTVSLAIDANALKPAACASLSLTNIIVGTAGGGTLRGAGANSLIIGGYGQDINGGAGDDCILAGGGNTTVNGGKGNDVLIGNPSGSGKLEAGQGTDTCYARGGAYTFPPSCETQLP